MYEAEFMMLRLFSMFAGYGGAEFALQKANIPFECAGYSEIDKNAIKCYEQNFVGHKNFGDCTKINPDDLPSFDLLTGGFPCQDVSLAGKRDLSEGRTNLYQEILRIARAKRPKYLLLENVKGLLSMNLNDDKLENKLLDKIVRDLKSLGYGVCYKVLNSKDFGVPQNRERIWFVCKLGGWDFMEFQFPNPVPLKLFVKDLLEPVVDKKYLLSEKQLLAIQNKLRCAQELKIEDVKVLQIDSSGKGYKSQNDRLRNIYGESPTISSGGTGSKLKIFDPVIFALRTRQEMKGEWCKGREGKLQSCEFNMDGITNSLTSVQKDNLVMDTRKYKGETEPRVYDGITPTLVARKRTDEAPAVFATITTENAHTFGILRRLTPKECFRLMGFLNDEINLGGLCDSAKYKLAGNGWDINVVSLIFKKMFGATKW